MDLTKKCFFSLHYFALIRFFQLLLGITWGIEGFANPKDHPQDPAGIVVQKSLMMTSPEILTSDASVTEWSFGAVMGELAKAYYQQTQVNEIQFDKFARQWLQVVAEGRPGIVSRVTCVWATGEATRVPACESTLLRPEQAPFKLLALNYRPDFVKDSCDHGGGHGEFRLTYGLTLERPDQRHPYGLAGSEMTVIFEYDLSKVSSYGVGTLPNPKKWPWEWAQDFADLSLGGDQPTHLDLLRRLVSRVIRYQPQQQSAELPVALGQIRINEVVGDVNFDPQQSAFLRAVGEQLEACYQALLVRPEDPAKGVLACRDGMDLSGFPKPLQMILAKLKNLLTVMARVIEAPLPVPVPTPLVGELFNVIGDLSDQIFAKWVMGEIELTPQGFIRRPAKDTPEFIYNGTDVLKKLIIQNADQIIDGSVQLDKILDGAGIKRALYPEANPLSPWRWYGKPFFADLERSALVKGRMAQLTCNGCHATQATIAAAPSILREILLQSGRVDRLKKTAQILLNAEKDHGLHVANLDGFYLISPLRDPGPEGLGHLAPELLRPKGSLDQRLAKMQDLIADGQQRCPR